jgi:transposase
VEGGNPVAVETIGNWYWIVDEIEKAGMVPQPVHARRAKMMLASVNKTDKLDAHGLNRLQRTGTLPTVWIPPAQIRDLRDLPRTRMVLSKERTRLKNRIHATLAKYAICIEGASDLFGKRGREELKKSLDLLPSQSRFSVERLLEMLGIVQKQIDLFEERMKEVFASSRELEILQTLPGVGFILAVVILLEVGGREKIIYIRQAPPRASPQDPPRAARSNPRGVVRPEGVSPGDCRPGSAAASRRRKKSLPRPPFFLDTPFESILT